MKIKTNFTKKEWIKENQVKGSTLTILGTVWEETQLIKKIPDENEIDFFQTSIEKLTGFFSIVYQSGSSLFAAVDHIRSHPLFYGTLGEIFFLSDNAEWVREQIQEEHIDPIAREEFLLTGYVTGQDTLFAGLKQLQAGEHLVVKNGMLKISRYFKFQHNEPEQWNEDHLYFELDLTARKSIQRLIEYANGRQIVVPLSGGYDSRLNATLLKELGYENVFTFTYGAKGNKESEYSKIVADSLGFKWYFVEYTPELWQKAWKDESRKKYYEYASNHVSLPHTQDWLAVKLMKECGEIEEGAVFVPGHSGDYICGGYIPREVFSTATKVQDLSFTKTLFERFYVLSPPKSDEWIRLMNSRIAQNVQLSKTKTQRGFADQFEFWGWQELQVKFICNSVRVYEYFGYDWWLPLWDYPIVEFFAWLPFSLRNHEWYKQYVTKLFSLYSKKTLQNGGAQPKVIKSIQSLVKHNPVARTTLRKIYLLLATKKDKLMSSRFGFRTYKELVRKGYSRNGIGAYCFMKEWDNKWGTQK